MNHGDIIKEQSTQEQANLYDHMEKLRDPSHTHALLLSELESMFKQAEMDLADKHMYRMEVDVEESIDRAIVLNFKHVHFVLNALSVLLVTSFGSFFARMLVYSIKTGTP